MAKTRMYNIDHQPVVVDHSQPAVMPGGGYDFTDEQRQGLSGLWSEEDPRRGLEGEKAFKGRRDKKPATPDETSDPAEPEIGE
jgi:hypothetical protein